MYVCGQVNSTRVDGRIIAAKTIANAITEYTKWSGRQEPLPECALCCVLSFVLLTFRVFACVSVGCVVGSTKVLWSVLQEAQQQ